MNDPYILYSPVIDNFIKIKKLSEKECLVIVEELRGKVKSPKFKITNYVNYMISLLVDKHETLIKGNGEGTHEALFECVCEVYPGFSIELLNKTLNDGFEDESEVGVSVSGLTLPQVEKIERKIKSFLVGQDSAVSEVVKCIKLMSSGLEGSTSMFFIGPTGVGKTELGKLLAKCYLGTDKRLLKVNCAEYSGSHEYAKLIGSPPGYIGHNEKGILTECAKKSSQWILLFDEIEKASDKLHNLLLGLLDEGKITDSHGTVLDFTNTIILFTSNVGVKDVVNRKQMGFGAEKMSYADSRAEVEEAFKDTFSPEFINRLDSIVYFNTLNKDDAKHIARLNLKHLPIRVTKKLVDWVVEESFSEDFGARNIKRFIKNNITLQVADKILEGNANTVFSPVFSKNKFQGLK